MNRFDEIASAVSKIDVRTASAFDTADQRMIEAAVRASAGGFEAVNGRIHDRLREWLAQASHEMLAKQRETLGATHPDTLQSMNNLARLLQDQGKLSEAEPLFRDALRLRRETLGETHPDTLQSMTNLARLLQAQGKLREAQPLFREALRGRRDVLGKEHADTLTSMTQLAQLLTQTCTHGRNVLKHSLNVLSCGLLFHDTYEAWRLLFSAGMAQLRTLGLEHPDTLTTWNMLAALDRSATGSSHSTVLKLRREALGDAPRHPDTLKAMHSLAVNLRKSPRTRSQAEPLLREALAGQREVLGNAHPATLASMSSLAIMLNADGKRSEAEPLWRDVLRCRRETLGDAHPDTLASMRRLALLLRAQGKLSDAEMLLREALRGLSQTLGDAHPATRTCKKNLSQLLKAIASQGKQRSCTLM